jgi:hypothetical protein
MIIELGPFSDQIRITYPHLDPNKSAAKWRRDAEVFTN